MNFTLLCIALLGLLVFAGGFYVSLCRNKAGLGSGYPDDPTDTLHKAVRAHANAVEYAPFAAILIYAIGQTGAVLVAWVPWAMGALVLARYCHFAGMVMSASIAKPQPLRFVGALGTYIVGTFLCVYLAYLSF
ncbi:MAPEG family protein [Parahaliea mediterranea]|uniref:MAPEG family protein n=1 Tax=Parahaliea mediterranea TaxID=651086 RepID=UPI000E2ED5DC|nr:MAPEG family protein [Parahaliea mediterranea]